jgi:hypothetical protein
MPIPPFDRYIMMPKTHPENIIPKTEYMKIFLSIKKLNGRIIPDDIINRIEGTSFFRRSEIMHINDIPVNTANLITPE